METDSAPLPDAANVRPALNEADSAPDDDESLSCGSATEGAAASDEPPSDEDATIGDDGGRAESPAASPPGSPRGKAPAPLPSIVVGDTLVFDGRATLPDPDLRWRRPAERTRGMERDRPRLRNTLLRSPLLDLAWWLAFQLIMLVGRLAYWVAAWARILGMLAATAARSSRVAWGAFFGTKGQPPSPLAGLHRIPRHLSLLHSPRSPADVAHATMELVRVALELGDAVEYLSLHDRGTITDDCFPLLAARLAALGAEGKDGAAVDLFLTLTSRGLDPPAATRVSLRVPCSATLSSKRPRSILVHFSGSRTSDRAAVPARLSLVPAGARVLRRQSPGGKWLPDAGIADSDNAMDAGALYSPNPSFPDPDLIVAFPPPPEGPPEAMLAPDSAGAIRLGGYPAWWLRIAEVVAVRTEECAAGWLASAVGSAVRGGAPKGRWVRAEALRNALRVFDGKEKREGR